MRKSRKHKTPVRQGAVDVPGVLFFLAFAAGQLATVITRSGRWSFLDLWVLATFLLWITRIARKRKLMHRTRLFTPAAAFAGIALVTVGIRALSTAAGIWENILYIIRWVVYAGAYGYIVTGPKRTKPWILTLYTAGLLSVALGFVQYYLYPDLRNLTYLGWDPHYLRMFALFFDPNFAGIVYVLTYITGLHILRDGLKVTWPVLAGQFMAAAAVVLTYSRSALVAFAVGTFVWFVTRRSFARMGALFTVIVIALFIVPRGWEGQNLLRTVSSQARLGSAVLGWDRFAASPVVGSGFVVRPKQYPASLPPSRSASVDTSFLYVLSAVGVFGFAAYVWLCIRIFRLGLDRLHKRHDALLMSSLAAVFVHSLFTNSMLYPWVMVWVWVLAAVSERDSTAGK